MLRVHRGAFLGLIDFLRSAFFSLIKEQPQVKGATFAKSQKVTPLT